MIAKCSSGKNFRALGSYLAAGRSGDHPDRVAWSAGRNLATADPTLAAKIMQATAQQNHKVEKPVYHVSISFDPADPVTRTHMEQIADRVLDRLGLREHQTVIVAHRDKEHPHMHLFVNRVHPDTGKSWERWKDYPKLQEVLRQTERDLHFREVQGSLYRLPEHQVEYPTCPGPGHDDTPTSGERRLAERTAQAPLVDRAKEGLAEYRSAQSWNDLHVTLAARGLTIERKGPGLVITDGETQVKASRVARDLSLGKLEAKFGARFPERVPAPDVATVARDVIALTHHVELVGVSSQASQAYTIARAHVETLDQAITTADRTATAFDVRLADAYRNPDHARRLFDAIAGQQGSCEAVMMMQRTPERFGELRYTEIKKALGLVVERQSDVAKRAAVVAASYGRDAVDARANVPTVAAVAHAREVLTATEAKARESQVALAEHEATIPDAKAVERQVGLAVARMLPNELRQLQRLLTLPQFELAISLEATVLSVVMDREVER